MPYSGRILLGGTTLVDACATLAYQRAASGGGCLDCADPANCGCCGSLHADNVYTDVAGTGGGEPAPWYDPATAESEDFYGLLVTKIDGLGPGDVSREVIQRADGMGGILGRETQAAPVITITALLMAASCCAADYGMRWLGSELREGCEGCGDCEDCDGRDLVFYTCCPGECDPDLPAEDPASCNRFRRTMLGVSMVRSPQIVDEQLADNDECGCIYEIEFQVAAANPCQYGDPLQLVSDALFTPDESDDCRFEWVSPAECADAGCQPGDDCFADPGCGPTVLPPQPLSPTVCGACDPWQISTVCAEMETNSIPLHAEGVPIIIVDSGDAPLRSTTIRFFSSDSPGELLDECNACSELTITRIPAESRLTIDAVRRKVTLECEGGAPVDASRLVVAGGGVLPFSWPVVTSPGPTWTVCAETDGDVAAANASISIALVSRECA